MKLVAAALLAAGTAALAPGLAFAAGPHLVQPGESLSMIADEYGTTVDALVQLNGLNDPDHIDAGTYLVVAPDAAPAPPLPSGPSVASPPVSSPGVSPGAPGSRTYQVVPGDTAYSIAVRFGVPLGALLDANGILDGDHILAGEVLTIPAGGGAPMAPAAAVPVVAPAAAARPAPVMPALLLPDQRALARARSGQALLQAAQEFGLEPRLVYSLAWYESGWQQSVISRSGAVGLMQLLPSTAEWAINSLMPDRPDLQANRPDWRYSELGNARVGAAVLRYLIVRSNGDLTRALAAYYQGWGSVARNGIYPETQHYIASVYALMQAAYWDKFGPVPWAL